jgi:hypothetical protein
MSDLIRNVIYRTRVEGEVSPSTKDSTDALKAVATEEKAAAQGALDLALAQDKAAASSAKSMASYDANAAKMRTMFTVLKEGTKNVLVYTAIDGSLKKVEAAFGTNSQGAVVLTNKLNDLDEATKRTTADMDALRNEASKVPAINPAQTRIEGPDGSAVTPIVPQVPIAEGPDLSRLADLLPALRGEAKEFVQALIDAGTEGGNSFERLSAAAREQFAILSEAVDQAKATEEGQAALANAAAGITADQRQFVDMLGTMAQLDEQQRATVESAIQLANAEQQVADALGMAEVKAQIGIDRIAKLRGQLDALLKRAAENPTIDPGPMARLIEDDIGQAQQTLAGLKLPESSPFAKSIELALKPLGAAANEAKRLSDNVRKVQPGIVPAVKETVTLAVQYKLAKAELDKLLEASKDGKATEQIIAAAQKTGELKNRMESLNDVVNAFNPDKKFSALTGVIQNSLGAFTALQGALGLIGLESEGTEKALLKVQSALAITQGLQALFGGLKDNLRNVRLLMAQAAFAARGLAVAEGQAAAGATTAGTAQKGLAGALTIARNGVRALWLEMVANPIGIVVAAIGVLIATIYVLATAEEEARFNADELLRTLEKTSEVDAFKATRRNSENSLESERVYLEELQKIAEERNKIGADATAEQIAQADLQADLARQEAERTRRRRDAGIEQRKIIDDITTAQREQAEAQKAIDENYLARLALFQQGKDDGLDEEDLESLAALQKKVEEQKKIEAKLQVDLNALRGKERNANLKAEIDNEGAILAAKKRLRDARKNDDPLAGSILAAQKELQRLQKIAQEVPQNAFPSGVLESIGAAIRKAEADLKRLQQTFLDDSAERLAERQRMALAMAELDVREQVQRLRDTGGSEAQIAELEATANDLRLARQTEFAEASLKLLQESGKATEAEIIAQQNRVDEARRAQGVGGNEGAARVRKAVRDELNAQLDEEQRHILAMADLDAQAAVTRARNAGASEREIADIEKRSQQERLRLEIEFQRERLAILVASGTATEAEVRAAQNRLREIEAQLAAPPEDDSAERMKEIVGRILDAADQIKTAGFDAWGAWSQAQEAAMDKQLDLQRRRVSEAEKVAEKGNAVMFEAERNRLEQMLKEREKAARRTAAIAQLEAASNAAVAITRAAAEGGGFLSAITIASTLIALGAGLIRARSLAENSVPSFFHGGEAPSWKGGYTGHGAPSQPSNAVGRKPYRYERREFVMDHVATGIGNNRRHFENILRNRVDLDKMLASNQQIVNVAIGNAGGMSEKKADEVIEAIKSLPVPYFKVDRKGFTYGLIQQQRRAERINRRR